ncbi:MAG: hypothetical protein QM791_11560 [Ferruginibacter sp.]
MKELFFVLLIVCGGIYLYMRNKNRSSFSFDENAVLLYDKNQLRIEFDKIEKIERDIGGSYRSGGIMHFKYLINYNDDEGQKQASLLVSSADLKKWRQLKDVLVTKKPGIKIDESIL